MSRPIKRWTLRELLNGSDRVCRDIVEHINTDYIPTIRESTAMLKPRKDGTLEIGDKTVVNILDRVQRAEDYARDLINRLEEIVQAIQSHADRV